MVAEFKVKMFATTPSEKEKKKKINSLPEISSLPSRDPRLLER